MTSNGTQYTTSDSLGSPRIITRAGGLVASRHDYQPFGPELGAGVGGRTTGMGFSNGGDNNRKKFTGYERDNETGLDFAQARYYSNTQGRFTSPDPFAGSATIGNPQTFNRYVYCSHNPVNATDASGMLAQPGSRNLSNWSGGAAAAEATDGISSWADQSAEEQPAAEEATKDASGSAGTEGKAGEPDPQNPQPLTTTDGPLATSVIVRPTIPIIVPDSATGTFNCAASSLGFTDRWIQAGGDQGIAGYGVTIIWKNGAIETKYGTETSWVTPANLPSFFGGKNSSAITPCSADRYKLAVFEDKKESTHWHVMHQDPQTGTWVSKNGPDPMYVGISNPRLFYAQNFHARAINATYWCMPIGLMLPKTK